MCRKMVKRFQFVYDANNSFAKFSVFLLLILNMYCMEAGDFDICTPVVHDLQLKSG